MISTMPTDGTPRVQATVPRSSRQYVRLRNSHYTYRLPGTKALKSLSLEVPTAFTE